MSLKKIRIRGARSSIPEGTIIGRAKGSRLGELQVLSPQDLQRMGFANPAAVNRASNLAGFTFFEEGLMLNKELLGQGSFSHDTAFVSGAAGDTVTSENAAAADAALTMWAPDTGGIYVQVGTITFAAGTKVGVVAWNTGFILPAHKIIKLYAPTPADATLAGVTGTVVGTKQ